MNIKRVKALMAEKGMNQKQLIDRAHVAPNVVRLGLAGKVKPSIVSVGRIAKALEVSPEEILDD